MAEYRAIQRTTRQSPYKMRLVIDQIRGKNVNEALSLLKFSKKFASKEISKVLSSAVANAEHKSREGNDSVDVDALFIKRAIVNEGPKLKRFMPAAQGRATPINKRTSHVEIIVGERTAKQAPVKKAAGAKKTATKKTAAKKTAARGGQKTTAKKAAAKKEA